MDVEVVVHKARLSLDVVYRDKFDRWIIKGPPAQRACYGYGYGGRAVYYGASGGYGGRGYGSGGYYQHSGGYRGGGYQYSGRTAYQGRGQGRGGRGGRGRGRGGRGGRGHGGRGSGRGGYNYTTDEGFVTEQGRAVTQDEDDQFFAAEEQHGQEEVVHWADEQFGVFDEQGFDDREEGFGDY